MTTLTEAQRTRLLFAYADSMQQLHELELQQELEREEDAARLNELAERIKWIEDTYEQALPVLPIARCPFTGQISSHSFDPNGFDGLWWQYHHPVRPESETAAGTHFLALTGAVRIARPPETVPFLVVPGPDAPYVVPRVLQLPQVRAVISMVGIGRHRAAAISYFANAPLNGVQPPTLWGTGWRSMDLEARPPADEEAADDASDFDFELAPWVRSGQLLWIAPGDNSLSLRSGLEGCPYLQVPGERKMQMLQNGKYWTE